MAAGVAEEVALIADAEWVIQWKHNRLGVPFPAACLDTLLRPQPGPSQEGPDRDLRSRGCCVYRLQSRLNCGVGGFRETLEMQYMQVHTPPKNSVQEQLFSTGYFLSFPG